MESKIIFKEKDKVYVTSIGWGKVVDAGNSTPSGWVGIETNEGNIFCADTHLVSFTEYTLEGFSQDRPEELPNVGDIAWVRSEFPSVWKIGHFSHKEDGIYYLRVSPESIGWSHRGGEIRTTNPYNPTKQ